MGKLIIDGNKVYEIDDKCMENKKRAAYEEKKEKKKQQTARKKR